MKKKLLCIILTAALLLGILVPGTALADKGGGFEDFIATGLVGGIDEGDVQPTDSDGSGEGWGNGWWVQIENFAFSGITEPVTVETAEGTPLAVVSVPGDPLEVISSPGEPLETISPHNAQEVTRLNNVPVNWVDPIPEPLLGRTSVMIRNEGTVDLHYARSQADGNQGDYVTIPPDLALSVPVDYSVDFVIRAVGEVGIVEILEVGVITGTGPS